MISHPLNDSESSAVPDAEPAVNEVIIEVVLGGNVYMNPYTVCSAPHHPHLSPAFPLKKAFPPVAP